jgi:hypothetical protein
MYLLHHHPHLQIELKEGKMYDIVSFGEVGEEELLGCMELLLTEEFQHVRSEVSCVHLTLLWSQREVIQLVVEVVGDEKVHLDHEASGSIRLHGREPLYQSAALLRILHPLEVRLGKWHG